jgi:hypothetical protein
MNRRRPNTPATHFQHVDRVHSKRLIELATGICENATDVGNMTYAEVVAEQRSLMDAIEPFQRKLVAAKREGRANDVILIGNRIDALNRRLAALKVRRTETAANRIGEGKRFLKAAIRDILPLEQADAIFQRAKELEAAAVVERGAGQ